MFHYCFTQTKREIINLVIHSLIARTDLEPHNLEVPGSSPGWSTIKIPNRLLFSSLLGVFFICVNRMSIKPLLTIRFYLTYATVNNGSVDISSITVSSFSI